VVHGAVKGFFQLFGAVALIVILTIPAAIWRLSEGPLPLDFISPYIEDALRFQGGGGVKLQSTILAWDENERTFDIRAVGVSLISDKGDTIAAVPELSFTISAPGLARGLVVPRMVKLRKPSIHLVREKDGHIEVAITTGAGQSSTASSSEIIEKVIRELSSPLDSKKPISHLRRIEILDGEVRLEDRMLGVVWRAPSAGIEIKRLGGDIYGKAHLSMELEGVSKVGLDMEVKLAGPSRRLEVKAGFAELRPAMLASLLPILEPARAANLPVGGTLSAALNLTDPPSLDSLTFALTGGKGQISLPAPLAAEYPVEGMEIRGAFANHMTRLTVDELFLDVGQGSTVNLSALVDGIGGEMLAKIEGAARQVPLERLPALWPESLAPIPRNWIAANMPKGLVSQASLSATVRVNGDDITIEHLGGAVDVEGATVDYLSPMPKVLNGVGRMTYDKSTIWIRLMSGQAHGLNITGGLLTFQDLDKYDQMADFVIEATGSLTDTLRLVDHKPLGYASALGINPLRSKGEAATKLRLRFPFVKNLTFEMVDIEAHSKLKNVALPGILMDRDVTQGALDLRVDRKGMDVAGKINLGGVPTELIWRENFEPKAPFRSRYNLNARLDNAGRQGLGLDFQPFLPPYFSGPLAADAIITIARDGKGELLAKLELNEAELAIPEIGYRKPTGTVGYAEAVMSFTKQGILGVPRFLVLAGDEFTAQGSVSFVGGQFSQVEFQKVKVPGSSFQGSLARDAKGGYAVEIKGDSFDAVPLLERNSEEKNTPPDPHSPTIAVSARIKKLRLDEAGGLDEVALDMRREQGVWRHVKLDGAVDDGKPFHLNLRPEGPKRRLYITSDDAGSTLRRLGYYEHMTSGRLELNGLIDDTKPNTPLEGRFVVSDYYIAEAPALARVLTVAALTGIIDLLRGGGMSFSVLDAPFIHADGRVQINDARAAGAALGITAKGVADLDSGRIDFEGTIVPAYALNSLFGSIPVLGAVFTGGEKGGGIFAFNYSMRGGKDNPEVNVNPLSGLTPGFLRHIFGILDFRKEETGK
jgi:hypothetical protein